MKAFTPFAVLVVTLASLTISDRLCAAETQQRGDWIETHDPESGALVQTMELTLHPRAEPNPALQYRLVANAFDQRDGNAAIYYFKAMGFFEQTAARDALSDFHRKAQEAAQASDQPEQNPVPYAWLEMPPDQLPLDDVKRYLRLLAFQRPFLAEAARCRSVSFDRNIRDVENPITYLLSEIQEMRQLARWQSLRCRLAIREGDIADAITILGQQYALANHLGQDYLLVSNLVGAAISSIAWTDMLYLLQQPEAPNLYWALASLPTPLISVAQSMPTEYNFLFLQVKTLLQVDETPRPAGYWQDLIGRMIPELRALNESSDTFSDDPEMERAAVVALIAAAYPGAKRYLIEVCQLDRSLVASFPTAQTVLLAVRRFYEHTRDEVYKWNHVPLWQTLQNPEFRQTGEQLHAEKTKAKLGWATAPTDLIMPAVFAARISTSRPQQTIAMLQTVEAIRDYAVHNSQLPESLNDLRLPAPVDPFTGNPISYELNDDHAILTGQDNRRHQYRLLIRLAG